MAKYNILIKAQGSNKELFKFFQENGTKYETEDIDTLTKNVQQFVRDKS